MSLTTASAYSVLPSGRTTNRNDIKGLLVLEGGCPLFVPNQIMNWVTQYCAGIKTYDSGVTLAVMYAGTTVRALCSMEQSVRDNLAVHFGSIKILGSYSPAADEYHEEVIPLDRDNRNVLHLLSNDFVDGMLHDRRFPQLNDKTSMLKAWEEALRIVCGISVPDYTAMSGFYSVDGTTMFAGKTRPTPTVKTITQLQQQWRETDQVIGSMLQHDPRHGTPDPKQLAELTNACWQR
jgi:hypothetical protein